MKTTSDIFFRSLKTIATTALVLVSALLIAQIVRYLYFLVIPDGGMMAYYEGTNFQKRLVTMPCTDMTFRPVPYFILGSYKTNISIRIKGVLDVPADSEYCFASLSEGGIRVFLDDSLLIDQWVDKNWNRSLSNSKLNLAKGKHRLVVEYFAKRRGARFRVEWVGGGIPPKTIIGGKYLKKR